MCSEYILLPSPIFVLMALFSQATTSHLLFIEAN
nr:MAG TPA: hypothetical protein [Caudoviricetes sp.]